MSMRKPNEHQRWQMSRLLGALRWGQTWFKAPPVLELTAARAVASKRYEDFAPQSQSSVDWLNQELKRPSSTLNQGTAHFAGKPYHWTQTYDGVIRLAPGASPW